MENNFVTWLLQEVHDRGWSNAEFCRRGGISQSMMTLVIAGHRKPGEGFCRAAAKAFDLPVEQVMRRAGMLPKLPAPAHDSTLTELLDVARHLTPEERRMLVDFASLLYKKREE